MGIKLKGLDKLNASLKAKADPEAIRSVVKMNGAELQQKAMVNAPYDTGTLRRSIKLELKDGGMTAEVTAQAEYAPYQEYGTRFMNAHPFMAPAFNDQKIQFEKDLKKL